MVKKRVINFLILFALVLPLSVMSQVLTGTVSSEGTPLVGANVVVKGTLRGTVTDVNGRYTLRLDPGTYQITFSLLGYATRTESVSLQANEERQLNVELQARAVEAQPVVVVGARASTRTVTDSPLPIDVLQFREISHTGQNSFDKILQYTVPSFNTVQTPVNDATALLDPWEIRNMGVSRTLILINGKRKNLSSLVYVQTSPSRGEAAVDISAIPMDAIKRVEILRDGASAQYGSDALAGVINIVLKDDAEGGYYTINTGITGEGDGERIGISLNNGSSIFGDKGFVNYTAEFSRVNEARRSGIVDAEGEASDFGADINEVRRFLAYDKFAGNRNSSPATSAAKFLINSGINLSDNTQLYANGAYIYKKVNSFANYRTPYWRPLSAFPYLADFFPNGPNGSYVGYVPTFDGDLVDYNATFGLRSEKNGWKYDLSYTLGFNSQDYTVLNSHNRSDIKDANGQNVYRENSPINFKPGGTIFSHKVGNIDVSKAVTPKLSIGVGTEFRSETFEIIPGDQASWDGIGADSFAGIRPENSGTFNRFNFGGYFDATYDFTKQFLVSATIRNEYYSDFGNAFVYKVSSRVKTPDEKLTLRGSYSTGFKAPQLHQIYTQRVQYSFVPGQGIQSIGLVNNISPQARILGVKPLEPEESKNLTFGIGAQLTPDFNLTLDFYNILISDRIVISNRVPFPPSTDPNVNFFTNSIDSKTTGLDMVLDYRNLKVGSGLLGLSVAGNVTLQNERDGDVLKVKGVPVIDAEQEALFFTSRPKQKFIASANYEIRRLNLSLNGTYFGKTEFRQLGLDPNLKTEFKPKVVTDLAATFDLFNNVSVTANILNVFDVLPEWKFVALNSAGAAILASPAQTKVQRNLITFNGRYPITTYDGSHFSQLGRIFNLSLTHNF
ncbi:MAG: TonB-dependent receptor [candidate division KSB1 bacterium]|nr:TonB-dependent receptor [candidate division KSB1 bacterium]MDZ7366648.1 TonB-dependent receptor [candidate division KSB1 bacterium]MDZ7404659.1 TonB-dependent receptor [candidate division KSB1 bacterium]